jgi:hypothetical protein
MNKQFGHTYNFVLELQILEQNIDLFEIGNFVEQLGKLMYEKYLEL